MFEVCEGEREGGCKQMEQWRHYLAIVSQCLLSALPSVTFSGGSRLETEIRRAYRLCGHVGREAS